MAIIVLLAIPADPDQWMVRLGYVLLYTAALLTLWSSGALPAGGMASAEGRAHVQLSFRAGSLATSRATPLQFASLAEWQSGHAADCNSVYAGSIPTSASNKSMTSNCLL